MTAAFTIFAKKISREKMIPFEINVDPFYAESNMNHLRKGMVALNRKEGMEHELIEVED